MQTIYYNFWQFTGKRGLIGTSFLSMLQKDSLEKLALIESLGSLIFAIHSEIGRFCQIFILDKTFLVPLLLSMKPICIISSSMQVSLQTLELFM